jgi:hypothetical protein
MRWAECAARMGDKKCIQNFIRKTGVKIPCEDLGVDSRIILKLVSKK